MSETHVPTARTRVVREAHRGVYERAAAYEILDEGFICHVGFVVDGQPFVIPTGIRTVGRQSLHSRLGGQPDAPQSR